ncbi:MAG: hypothetical protein JWN40_933 [Phycisphaerales bacterium]|nr:hypothetical protein [Phycisphaerales bacterium]
MAIARFFCRICGSGRPRRGLTDSGQSHGQKELDRIRPSQSQRTVRCSKWFSNVNRFQPVLAPSYRFRWPRHPAGVGTGRPSSAGPDQRCHIPPVRRALFIQCLSAALRQRPRVWSSCLRHWRGGRILRVIGSGKLRPGDFGNGGMMKSYFWPTPSCFTSSPAPAPALSSPANRSGSTAAVPRMAGAARGRSCWA